MYRIIALQVATWPLCFNKYIHTFETVKMSDFHCRYCPPSPSPSLFAVLMLVPCPSKIQLEGFGSAVSSLVCPRCQKAFYAANTSYRVCLLQQFNPCPYTLMY